MRGHEQAPQGGNENEGDSTSPRLARRERVRKFYSERVRPTFTLLKEKVVARKERFLERARRLKSKVALRYHESIAKMRRVFRRRRNEASPASGVSADHLHHVPMLESQPKPVETERMMRIKWYALLLMEKADQLMNWLAPHLTNYVAPEPLQKLPWWWTAVRQPIGKMFEVAADTGFGFLGWKKFTVAAGITGALNMLPGFAFYTIPFVYPVVLAMVMFKLRVLDLDFLVRRVVNPAVNVSKWILKGIGAAVNLIADGVSGDLWKKTKKPGAL